MSNTSFFIANLHELDYSPDVLRTVYALHENDRRTAPTILRVMRNSRRHLAPILAVSVLAIAVYPVCSCAYFLSIPFCDPVSMRGWERTLGPVL